MRLLRLLLILVVVLMAIVPPTFAQDDVSQQLLSDVWLGRMLQISALLVTALLGGGAGYIVRAATEARDARFMTVLENQYNNSNDAFKQMIVTLEAATRYLAVSIPMNETMRRSFDAVADFVDEVSDGVPVADKNTDSTGDPGELQG